MTNTSWFKMHYDGLPALYVSSSRCGANVRAKEIPALVSRRQDDTFIVILLYCLGVSAPFAWINPPNLTCRNTTHGWRGITPYDTSVHFTVGSYLINTRFVGGWSQTTFQCQALRVYTRDYQGRRECTTRTLAIFSNSNHCLPRRNVDHTFCTANL